MTLPPISPPVTPTAARFLCVGTHHKSGTIWMRKVLRAIASDQDIPFMQCHRAKRLVDAAETGPQFIVNWSSSFPQELMDMGHARQWRLLRWSIRNSVYGAQPMRV